jgi:hypothetical protein
MTEILLVDVTDRVPVDVLARGRQQSPDGGDR